jgi:hypothetical protein
MLISMQIQAQGSFSLNIQSWKPKGTFAENLVGSKPGGIGLGYMKALPKHKKLSVGGTLGAVMYGYREYSIVRDTNTIRVYEDDCVLQATTEARYVFKQNAVLMPYINGRIGWNGFFSHIDPMDKNTNYETKFQWQGHAATMGLGFGTRINLFKLIFPKNTHKVLQLDLNQTYNAGTQTSYRHFKDREAPKDDLNFGVHKSATPFGSFTMGLVFQL